MREGAVWQGRDTTQEIYFFFFLATASFLSASRLSIK
jgi:hypothetical protein